MTFMTAYILKNGSQFASSTQQGTLNTGTPSCSVSALTYLNGSTDYITVAGYLSASAAWTVSGQASGFLARKA